MAKKAGVQGRFLGRVCCQASPAGGFVEKGLSTVGVCPELAARSSSKSLEPYFRGILGSLDCLVRT